MGGGGSSGAFDNRSPSDLNRLVRSAEDKSKVAQFETVLASTLGELLAGYNSRDNVAASERLDGIKIALQNSLEGSFDQFFGGSVAKRTYVDGLSDIDSLVLINGSDLRNKTPRDVLTKLERILVRKLGGQVEVSHVRMAVTIEYDDKMVIQILPALRGNDGHLHVPSSRTDKWSKIDPVAFQDALTRRNRECAGKLVPTIKLAKAIVGQLPETQRLSGYHMESLGIAAFRHYAGEKTTVAMLPAFFDRARELVLTPIKDRTGQSVHVDGYLGPADSEARQAASHVLGRLARRMRNATAAGSTAQWRALFGLDE